MILYHWTHRSNLRSIRLRGLLPTYALGKKKCVWACNRHHIGWALGHVAARHGHSPDEFSLIRVTIHRRNVRRSAWKGVYTCDRGYTPQQITVIGGLLANEKA